MAATGDPRVVTLRNDTWQVGLLPENGGSVAFGRVLVTGVWVDLLRPTPEDRLGEWWDVASYPLIPWSNRIRHGMLLWDGEDHQLRRWGTEDFAMHGTAVEFPWRVVDLTPERAVFEFDSHGYFGVNFPWDFTARVEYALDGRRLNCRTTLANADKEEFPAGVGHHPYFVRSLTSPAGTPIGGDVRLQINCERAYPLTNGMADGPAGRIPSASRTHGDCRGTGTVRRVVA